MLQYYFVRRNKSADAVAGVSEAIQITSFKSHRPGLPHFVRNEGILMRQP